MGPPCPSIPNFLTVTFIVRGMSRKGPVVSLRHYSKSFTVIFNLKKKHKNSFRDISSALHAERIPAIKAGGHTGHIPSVKGI